MCKPVWRPTARVAGRGKLANPSPLPGPTGSAGVVIALSADFRIAAQSARLVTGWGNLAFSGDFGGTWFLTRMLGSARALDLLLNNGRIDADQALAWGLFNRVVP